MTSFDMAMKNFTTAEQNTIRKKLTDWSTKHPYGQRVAKNILREHFLPNNKMEELLRFILNDTSGSHKTFEKKYKDECIKYVLSGGAIRTSPFPKFFGAAVEIKSFREHLTKNNRKRFKNRSQANDFIKRLESGYLSPWKSDVMIKPYSVWATWNESDTTAKPFEFCNTNHPDEVRANLGLDKKQISDKLILFIYTIPSSVLVNRPTIADAQLSQYFEPPFGDYEEAGRTVTWAEEKNMKGFKIESRPEGIHTRIELRNLSLPITIR